ncbi:MAG: helix-turn-helix transcriptional regulator [Lachnospiraceae bacterium]|nr:helix-turn-helix transcriptional regulator [Lachnospiraceae bacterium]
MVKENRIIQVKDINIGNNIRKYRKQAGYKQIDMVTRLQLAGYDISTFSYNRIEKGTQNPTVSLLLHLCNILSCDMNELFGINI